MCAEIEQRNIFYIAQDGEDIQTRQTDSANQLKIW